MLIFSHKKAQKSQKLNLRFVPFVPFVAKSFSADHHRRPATIHRRAKLP
jgi:hypothetical protein